MKLHKKIVAAILLTVALIAVAVAIQRTLTTEYEDHTSEFTWNGKTL